MRTGLARWPHVLVLALGLVVGSASSALAFMHEQSSIRFEEHSRAVFARARQEGRATSGVHCPNDIPGMRRH